MRREDEITKEQITELLEQDKRGRCNKRNFQNYLQNPEEAHNWLLKFLGVVTLSATIEKFIAVDNFIIGKNKIKSFGFNDDFFKLWFLEGNGKIEDPTAETVLCCHKLLKDSNEDQILADLGDEKKIETTLNNVFTLMEKQKNGENKVLALDAHANIFYVRDVENELQAVHVHCHGDDFLVCASPFPYPFRWLKGSRVFTPIQSMELLSL